MSPISSIEVREGDFVETVEGLIFDVKGLVHPPSRVIAFLRYYPTPEGKRVRDGRRYDKVYHLAERFDILRHQFPHYLYVDPVFGRELQGVSHEKILKIFHPDEALRRLRELTDRDSLQQDVLTFADIVAKEARIGTDRLGISGSVQVDLHGPTSDIDLIVYGKKAGRATELALRRAHLTPEQGIAGYTLETYRPVYQLRWSASDISIETMFRVDSAKAMHGIFGGHHYFIRAVLDWNEIEERYGDRTYQQIGYARAKCKITDHSESLFTPCRYEIKEPRSIKGEVPKTLREIVSFRGRFCEQARQDEEVIVQGTIEKVQSETDSWSRFLLGDNPKDILIPSYLL